MASNKAFSHQPQGVSQMTNSQQRAAFETQLAVAHRALWRASSLAYDMHDESAASDCEQLQREVGRVAETSLKKFKGTRKSSLANQLRLV